MNLKLEPIEDEDEKIALAAHHQENKDKNRLSKEELEGYFEVEADRKIYIFEPLDKAQYAGKEVSSDNLDDLEAQRKSCQNEPLEQLNFNFQQFDYAL